MGDAAVAPPKERGGFPDTPDAAAEELRKAWERNDRPGAADVATTNAIDQLFKTPYQNTKNIKLQGCGPNPGFEGKLACDYQYEGGSAHFIMKKENSGYSITSIEYKAD